MRQTFLNQSFFNRRLKHQNTSTALTEDQENFGPVSYTFRKPQLTVLKCFDGLDDD